MLQKDMAGKHVRDTHHKLSTVMWLLLTLVLLLLALALALPLLLRRWSLLLRSTAAAAAALHGDDVGAGFKGLVEVADVAGHVLVAGDGKWDEGLVGGKCISAELYIEKDG